MEIAEKLVSPKQVARAIGVSESSLKRWCDRGLINTVRTAGGHRKMQIGEVLEFIRQNDQSLTSPELLGLPPASVRTGLGIERGKDRLVEALLKGNDLLSRQIVFDLFLAKHPVSVICDQVIGAAFHAIGDRWECRETDVYQERRACEIALRIIFELRRSQRSPVGKMVALGGTIEGDHYTLPTAMSELVLRDADYAATSLGNSIPFDSMIKAINETRPAIFWLSVSHIPDKFDFLPGFSRLSDACSRRNTALVVGGRELKSELRQKMKFAAHCDNMQHLESFARVLLGSQSARETTPENDNENGGKTKRRRSGKTS